MHFHRPWIFLRTLAGLRLHDLRAARTWVVTMYPGRGLPARLGLFIVWALRSMWRAIPDVHRWAEFRRPPSRTAIWLAEGNPFENYPWKDDPSTQFPPSVEVAVIGAGFVGAAAAYHWSKAGRGMMAVLEMGDPASGSAGRNEGLVVMGRYYYMVYETVLSHFKRAKPEESLSKLKTLAHQYARAYAQAAYINADLIEQTIREEGIDCDYNRKGWVQAADRDRLKRLEESTRMAQESGFADWIQISSREAFERSGLQTPFPAGFSVGAATWHPAKWVWGLFRIALASPQVRLFTRTPVLKVEDHRTHYTIHTVRGPLEAQFVINATESHTPLLFPRFRGIVQPHQTQAAFGSGDVGSMKEGVGISEPQAFFGRHGRGLIFGSDATPVPDRLAGSSRPSRFITSFVLHRLRHCFGVGRIQVSHEWSGTVSYTPDEFPLVGLMDSRGLYMVGGMAGSGSAVSFLGARHVVYEILGIETPDYYPQEYFSPRRFF